MYRRLKTILTMTTSTPIGKGTPNDLSVHEVTPAKTNDADLPLFTAKNIDVEELFPEPGQAEKLLENSDQSQDWKTVELETKVSVMSLFYHRDEESEAIKRPPTSPRASKFNEKEMSSALLQIKDCPQNSFGDAKVTCIIYSSSHHNGKLVMSHVDPGKMRELCRELTGNDNIVDSISDDNVSEMMALLLSHLKNEELVDLTIRVLNWHNKKFPHDLEPPMTKDRLTKTPPKDVYNKLVHLLQECTTIRLALVEVVKRMLNCAYALSGDFRVIDVTDHIGTEEARETVREIVEGLCLGLRFLVPPSDSTGAQFSDVDIIICKQFGISKQKNLLRAQPLHLSDMMQQTLAVDAQSFIRDLPWGKNELNEWIVPFFRSAQKMMHPMDFTGEIVLGEAPKGWVGIQGHVKDAVIAIVKTYALTLPTAVERNDFLVELFPSICGISRKVKNALSLHNANWRTVDVAMKKKPNDSLYKHCCDVAALAAMVGATFHKKDPTMENFIERCRIAGDTDVDETDLLQRQLKFSVTLIRGLILPAWKLFDVLVFKPDYHWQKYLAHADVFQDLCRMFEDMTDTPSFESDMVKLNDFCSWLSKGLSSKLLDVYYKDGIQSSLADSRQKLYPKIELDDLDYFTPLFRLKSKSGGESTSDGQVLRVLWQNYKSDDMKCGICNVVRYLKEKATSDSETEANGEQKEVKKESTDNFTAEDSSTNKRKLRNAVAGKSDKTDRENKRKREEANLDNDNDDGLGNSNNNSDDDSSPGDDSNDRDYIARQQQRRR